MTYYYVVVNDLIGGWDICEGKSLPDDLMEETRIDITAGWR
ncbi:hypothetical protein LCGC14_2952650 [marine sediment metagenome]|uniref:Uncharacterized protein n=1 Tax=marine sediment metagenome TaxID=412755 RepID=A0A0F8ZMF0_9ZZZZ